jgi:hypothetical protein
LSPFRDDRAFLFRQAERETNMFYIKVMNKEDCDYTMYSTNRYRVSRKCSGDEIGAQVCEGHIICDEGSEDHARAIKIESVAYIMSDTGKTIDTIYVS